MNAKKTLTLLFSLTFVLLAAQTARAQTFKSENLFYMVDTLDSFTSFKNHAGEISIVVPAAYHLDQYGTVYGGVDPRVLSIAKAHHVMVMPIIATFDQQAIHTFLNDPKARARAIRLMLFYADKYHYYGWQFDLENVHVTDGDAYTDFYRQAADAMHKHGYKISMAVVKSDQPAPNAGHSGFSRFLYENWRGAFNFRKLAKIGDFMSFMSYDEHTSLTPPGPVAGIPWMVNMANYLVKLGIDPQKISFGIPTYSDYWYPAYSEKKGPHSTRDEISYREVENLLDRYQAQPHWMAKQGVDYARWTDPNGVFSWMFIENARSFAKKLQLIPKYHFRGFSAWVLGYEDPGIWKVLAKQTQPIHYSR
ncbi:MAG TPA: glycosyl hydrolase family 18 protein [Gammaproteobacteria bacterium]|nr:glycosyl hydrolase family 18 protein [Gammaproteobacteria bacterium]